jgi:hypothetical protein
MSLFFLCLMRCGKVYAKQFMRNSSCQKARAKTRFNKREQSFGYKDAFAPAPKTRFTAAVVQPG